MRATTETYRTIQLIVGSPNGLTRILDEHRIKYEVEDTNPGFVIRIEKPKGRNAQVKMHLIDKLF